LIAPVDEARLGELVREHGDALLGFLTYRTGDRHLAEDLLGDTFERAFKARRRFDPRKASERTWLTAIALNVWRDHARRRGAETRMIEALSEPPPHDDFTTTLVEREALMATLATLPADEREALALVYGADLTAKQAAAVLDVKVTTVQGRVYRGLRRMRDGLG
jgi:RNA polymerase sigma-70 factor (ECF subfamily)